MLAIFFIYDQTLKKEWKAGLKGPERHRSLGCHINTWQRNLPKAAKGSWEGRWRQLSFISSSEWDSHASITYRHTRTKTHMHSITNEVQSKRSFSSECAQAKLPNGKELTCYKSPLFFSLYNKELQRKHGAWGILAGDKGHPEWNTAGEESSPTPPDNQLKCPEIFHKPSKYWFLLVLSLFSIKTSNLCFIPYHHPLSLPPSGTGLAGSWLF